MFKTSCHKRHLIDQVSFLPSFSEFIEDYHTGYGESVEVNRNGGMVYVSYVPRTAGGSIEKDRVVTFEMGGDDFKRVSENLPKPIATNSLTVWAEWEKKTCALWMNVMFNPDCRV